MSTVQRERGAAIWVALFAIVALVAVGLLWRPGADSPEVDAPDADKGTGAEKAPLAQSAPETQPKEAGSRHAPGPNEERLELITATGVHALDVEIAATPEKQALGLMFRTHLADDKGMLFPHPEPRELSMWMRNTYIPLDMVFIRADGTVHRIEARTEPFSERIISSEGPVSAVLEIAGGAAQRLGLKPGDKVVHPTFGKTP
jgi:uncharacterized membrane protein (UPF0127 family)